MVNAGISDEPSRDRAEFARQLSSYLRVATYRALFETSGLNITQPDDEMVDALAAFGVGDIAKRIAEFRDSGADEIAIAPAGTAYGSLDRYLETLVAVQDFARV